jgi:protein-tyrosine phosphatase
MMDRRVFVAGLGSAGAASLVASSQASTLAAPITAPSATRIDANQVRLTWAAGAGSSSNIFMSNDPAAALILATPLQARVRGGTAIVNAPSSPRPYFAIRTGLGREVRVAERILPLTGGRNFRDLGGYRGAAGKSVAWGRIYRSGVMSGLTRPDIAYLNSLGVAIVCDLRSPQELISEPSALIGNERVKIMSHDYDLSSSMSRLGAATTRPQAIEAFADAYIGFASTLRPQYTDMFASLVESDAPFALNCSAGKDRTGVGSALILSVLGVDRATVIADYALSETYVPVSYYMNLGRSAASTPGSAAAAQANPYTRMAPDVARVILGSVPDVMRLALTRMEQEFGGPVELAKQRFGLTDAGIRQMRRKFLV